MTWKNLILRSLPPSGVVTNQQLYEKAPKFRRHFPENRNVRAKIRAVLQQLSDDGVLFHVREGVWRVRPERRKRQLVATK